MDLQREMLRCSVDRCEKPVKVKGQRPCSMHYWRITNKGDLHRGRPEIEERFWRGLTKRSDGCWTWGRGPDSRYRSIQSNGCAVGVHRFAYELLVGPIPAGFDLDHLCRRPACCNPAHLEPVTGRTNILRGTSPAALNSRKSRCARGHALSGDNLYVNPRGHRQCRVCAVERTRDWRRRVAS